VNRRQLLIGASALAMALSLNVNSVLAATKYRFAHFSPTSDPNHETALSFAEKVKGSTNGEYEVEIFPSAQLGGEVDAIEGVLLGTIDISVPSAATLANWVPEMNVLNMPFAFRDWDHYTKVAQGELLDKIIEKAAEKNIRVLGMLTSGSRQIMTRDPLNSFEDLRGRKIRTVQNPVHVATFNAFGANATAIAYTEVYSSLQTGVVDGGDAANTNYYTEKFYEVAPYWALVNWLFYSNCIIMREDKYQALPDEQKALLSKIGRETGAEHFVRYRKSDEGMLDKLKAAGVTVTTLDAEPFRAASQKVYDEFLKTETEKDLLNLILSN